MKLIAIVGSGRNGSTLLTRLLDGIEGVYVHPIECNFLSAMDNLAVLPFVLDRVQKNVITRPLRHLRTSIPTKRLLRYYAAHFAEITRTLLAELEAPQALGPLPDATLREKTSYLPSEFVPRFLAATAVWLGQPTETAIFKTIETPYIADYERLFPDMRFIHILRDPVEVWSSQKRSLVANKSCPPWYLGMDNLHATIECRWLPHAEALASRKEDHRHYVIRYEDLIGDPAASIRQITDWLQVRTISEPATQTVLGGKKLRTMIAYPSQKGVETPRAVVKDLKQRFAYETVVTQRERDLIVFRTQHVARLFGYLRDENPLDRHLLLREWVPPDMWDFRHTSGLKSWLYTAYSLLRRRLYVLKLCLSGAPANRAPVYSK